MISSKIDTPVKTAAFVKRNAKKEAIVYITYK